MKIRIDLTDDILARKEFSLFPTSDSVTAPDSGDDTESAEIPDSDTIRDIEFDVSLSDATIAGHEFSRYDYPCMEVCFDVPDSDLERVKLWFGIDGASSQSGSASDTLQKRMSSAVFGALDSLGVNAERIGLFIYPFKIGAAWRLANGSHIAAGSPHEIYPSRQPPLLIVHDAAISDHRFSCLTEVRLSPARASITLPPTIPDDSLSGKIVALDFYICRQYPMRSGRETITGVRTYSLDSTPSRCWQYERTDANEVMSAMHAISAYRVAASVRLEDAARGVEVQIPSLSCSDLSLFDSFPTFNPLRPADSSSPSATDEPSSAPGIARILTAPLHLGYPEERKWVRALSIRGIFSRRADDCHLRLFGSHHRSDWQLVASCRGAHLRLLRGCAFRWWRVEAEALMPQGGKLDALTFEVKRAARD